MSKSIIHNTIGPNLLLPTGSTGTLSMYDQVWRCRDGRMIPVRQMEDRHLHNCIRMILRNRSWRRKWLDRLLLEVTIREIERK